MKKIGTLKTPHARDITGSKIGIGFECLDRQMWDDTDEVYRLTGELGVKHARIQSGWNRCETTPGEYDFDWLDRSIDKLLEQGIQPWLNLGYGNKLHTEAEEADAVGWAPINSDSERQAWTAYIGALVEHVRDRLTHYEVWNEPNITPFWVGGPDAAAYMELLKLTVPVIREHHPEAKIIGGATAGLDLQLIERYLRDGMAELIDIYSFHRYHINPELQIPRGIESLRATFDAHGGEHIQLWQAESGCPSETKTTQALANVPVNEELQAQVASRSLLSDLMNGLDYTCWFHLSDFKFYYRNGLTEETAHFGLLSFDNPPRVKPSYGVVQRLCSLFDAETVPAPRQTLAVWSQAIAQSDERYAFNEVEVALRQGSFTRRGKPLAVWWYPANLLPSVSGDEPFAPVDVSAHIWAPDQQLEDPVVVDLLTGEVFEPEYTHWPAPHGLPTGTVELQHVPLKATPMLATDRSAIRDLLPN